MMVIVTNKDAIIKALKAGDLVAIECLLEDDEARKFIREKRLELEAEKNRNPFRDLTGMRFYEANERRWQ